MTIDERLEKLAEREEALAESVELMRGSVSDLTGIVHAMVADTREQRERDRQYLTALAQLLKGWAGDGKGETE